MIYTGEDHFTLLQQVTRHLKTRNHIAGKYYLDAEMQHLEETQAPGIDVLRQAIAHQLRNEFVRHLPHAALMEKLAQAGKDYQVLSSSNPKARFPTPRSSSNWIVDTGVLIRNNN